MSRVRVERRAKRALLRLAEGGALRVKPGPRDDTLWLAGPEGGASSAVLLYHIPSRGWRDHATKTRGSGFFSAVRRLAVPTELVVAALVADATEGEP